MKKFALLLTLAVLCRTGQPASDAPATATGPQVLFEADATLLTSTIQVVVRSGSSEDPQGKTGLMSLLSELMLRGTKSQSREEFQSQVERMGASLNVRHTHDATVFEGRVIKENTVPFLKLFADVLVRPALSEKEFAPLKTEVLADIAHLKNSNNRLSGLALRRELFAGTPLQTPIDGSLRTVGAIKHPDLILAYHSRFHRGNLTFAVASALKETELTPLLTDIWKAMPPGELKLNPSIPPNVPKKTTLVVVHKPATSTGSVMLGQAGLTAQDPLRHALTVGNFSFGAEPLVSRLFRIVRSELGWTYAINSTYHATGTLAHQQGFYTVVTTPSIEYTGKTILKVLSLWKEYMESGLKEEELTLAKESLVNSYPFEFDSAEKRLWQRLYSYLYNVPLLSPEEYAKTINDISHSKLKDALKSRQTAEGWMITVVADKDVIAKQLEEEQKDVPKEKRITISKILTPDSLVE